MEKEAQLPGPPADKSLTLAAKKLAGSAQCLNCGTELKGPFCYYCGQPDKNLMRFFPALLREMLEDFMDFDSRFMRTLKPLLFKPGKLTRDYLDGRRFRYVPPLRLYIFSSLAVFFLIALVAGSSLDFESNLAGEDPNIRVTMDDGDAEDLREALEGLEQVQPGLADKIVADVEKAASEEEARQEEEPEEFDININGEPWDPETNPFVMPLMPDWVNRWINKEIGESPQKGRAIEENPNLMVDKVMDVLPGTMFVLLPLVALLFKFWYLFAKKYYVEHLIFALHNHAFIFVLLLLMMLMGLLPEWQEPSGEGPVTTTVSAVKTVMLIWMPVYLFISLKRVYRQGWWLTIAKFSAIGMSYMMLLGMVTAFVAVLSFVLL